MSGAIAPPSVADELANQRLVLALGWAGVLPMLGCVIMIEMPLGATLLKTYSLAIIAFLSGSWWSTALMKRDLSRWHLSQTLLASNAIVIVGVSVVIFMDDRSLLVLGVLFGGLLWGERYYSVFSKQPKYYRRMRTGVTCAVIVFHFIAFGLSL